MHVGNAEAPRQQVTRYEVTPRDTASILDNERAQDCATTTNGDRGIPGWTTGKRSERQNSAWKDVRFDGNCIVSD